MAKMISEGIRDNIVAHFEQSGGEIKEDSEMKFAA